MLYYILSKLDHQLILISFFYADSDTMYEIRFMKNLYI